MGNRSKSRPPSRWLSSSPIEVAEGARLGAPGVPTMAAEYTYRVSAWWTSGRTGLAKCESSPNTIHFSEAAELGGLQGRWTPEQLLLCALAGCFTTTFHEVAHAAKFDFTDLEVEIEGSVRRNRGTG